VIFEKVANRILAGDRDARRRTLSTYGMTASNQMPDEPSFTMSPTPSRSKFLDSKNARHIESVNFNDASAYNEFSMGDIYFVPTSSSNSLLDSFCVDYSNGSGTSDVEVDVWLFQVTLSPRHGGSAARYDQIKAAVRAAIAYAETWFYADSQSPGPVRGTKMRKRALKVDTTVHYVLVCPDEPIRRKWIIPAGWLDAKQKGVKYAAECFLIQLDVLNISIFLALTSLTFCLFLFLGTPRIGILKIFTVSCVEDFKYLTGSSGYGEDRD